MRALGGEVRLVGESYTETQSHAWAAAEEEGRAFIAPYDDPLTIAGQGTIGVELLKQLGSRIDRLHAVFVAVGGGGLLSGIAAYIKALRPGVRVIGVEPTGANCMALSLKHGERVQLSKVDAFADGVAVKSVGAVWPLHFATEDHLLHPVFLQYSETLECAGHNRGRPWRARLGVPTCGGGVQETFRLCQKHCDGIVLVDSAQISAAIKDVFQETRSVLEPAGAVAVAGAEAYLSHHGMQVRLRGTLRCAAIWARQTRHCCTDAVHQRV